MIAFNPPKLSFKNLLNILGEWNIVVVGNKKKNDIKWKLVNHSKKYVYLSIKDQLKLGYKTIQYLTFNNYSRKNIGYLYAIQHGAKEIYEIDEDLIISKIQNIDIKNNISICYGVRNDSLMINPYSYFGENNIWPRGFRISDIGKDENNNFYNIKSNQLIIKPLIFQGLINGIPDVDSFFLQTRFRKNTVIDVNFLDIYPLLYFPGQYIPLNSKNTKYLYDIFPFIILPISLEERISDIVRGFIIQRFAWGYNGSIIYHKSETYKNKSSYFISSTIPEEKDLFIKLDQMLVLINDTTKTKNNNPIELLFIIINNLIKGGILQKKDLDVYKAFLYDLSQFGYIFPNNFSNKINYNYKDFLNIYSEMKLYLPSNPNLEILNNNAIKIRNHYFSYKTYDNILLIINYNHKGFEYLNSYLLNLYKYSFKNIVFVSPGEINNNNIISCNNSGYGCYSYICLKEVFNKYPKFKGYLFINDDDFLKTWELDNFDFNIPWLYTFHPIDKNWGHSYWCYPIYNILNHNLVWKSNLIKIMGYYEIAVTIADFYYLPNSLLPKFIEITEKMYESKNFLECVVPTTMGIILAKRYQLIYFVGLWGDERKEAINYLHKAYHQITVHPIKFSEIDNKIKVELYIFFINAKEY